MPAPVASPARALLDFIDASPSPWHAVQQACERLRAAGFSALDEGEAWDIQAGGRYFVVRGGASLIAFVVGTGDLAATGMRMIGAHTDSPGLRLKPMAAHSADGFLRLGVEVYGGPILATFADRDLSLAGRVNLRSGRTIDTRLIRFDAPLLRLPNLAIHMNRDVNEGGLKFNKQTELPLLWSVASGTDSAPESFLRLLSTRIDCDPAEIINWELSVFDTQPGAFWGAGEEFIASRQLDNLASCHAALSSLLSVRQPEVSTLCAFFDHEEVGSTSAAGADGSFLDDVLTRVANRSGVSVEDQRRMLANSFFISADMAHAWNPNFPAAYEPSHRVMVNAGPVIKTNANQRYSTGAETAARFMAWCEEAGVPCQQYAHRTDLGCGSTIGPLIAARLGVASVDVGAPMWAMHSLRESAGAIDHGYMIDVFSTYFGARPE